MIRKIINFVFCIFCFIASVTSSAAAESPGDVVKETADSVIERINSERSILEAHPEKIGGLVEELIVPHFDFAIMSKLVLGKNWAAATEEQRTQFIEQFKTLLVRTYSRALMEYSDREIKYFPVEDGGKPNLAVVRTELIGGVNFRPLPIAYRLYQKNDRWNVIDVTVDGASLVSTYRGSFANQIQKNGFDSLVQGLTEKNARLTRNLTSNNQSE